MTPDFTSGPVGSPHVRLIGLLGAFMLAALLIKWGSYLATADDRVVLLRMVSLKLTMLRLNLRLLRNNVLIFLLEPRNFGLRVLPTEKHGTSGANGDHQKRGKHFNECHISPNNTIAPTAGTHGEL